MDGFTEIAAGLRFPEGPVALPDGGVLLVEIAAGRLTRVSPQGRVDIVAELGGGPNGLAIGPDDKAYVCNNGGFTFVEAHGLTIPAGPAAEYAGGSIQRVDMVTGAVETLYDGVDGSPLKAPNDLVFDAYGGFWFTDHGQTHPRSRDRGGLYYALADGSSVREVAFPLESPNGVALYVAETYTAQLWAFDLAGPGEIAPTPSLLGTGGRFLHRPAGFRYFDSLAVDAAGDNCVATIGEAGVSVISPTGEPLAFHPTDDPFTTNLCFGGPNAATAFVTLSGTGRLVATRWPRPGLPLAHQP